MTLKMLQPELHAGKVGPAQAVAEANPASKPTPKPVAETTGSAPMGESVASTDCEHQTWPNLSRACMEAMQANNRGPRVISTDKLEKPAVSAIEAPAPANPAPAAVFAAPESSPSALVGKAQAEEKPSQPADQKEAKQDKHERVAKKAKRKPKLDPKAEPKAQPNGESNDDDDHVANAASDDQTMAIDDPQSDDRIARGRVDRRRIVERRPVREYNVPADDGSGDRRVVVIRRSGGGLFENLFGGFGN